MVLSGKRILYIQVQPAVLHLHEQTICRSVGASATVCGSASATVKTQQFYTNGFKCTEVLQALVQTAWNYSNASAHIQQFCARTCQSPVVLNSQVQTACSYSCAVANSLQFCTRTCKSPAVLHTQVRTASSSSFAGANYLQFYTCGCRRSVLLTREFCSLGPPAQLVQLLSWGNLSLL
jgi:hypothetical protein